MGGFKWVSSIELPIKMALGSSNCRVNRRAVKLVTLSVIAIFGVPPIAQS